MTETEQPDWEAAQSDYELGVDTVAEIASRHGVDMVTLQNKRRAGNWRRMSVTGVPRARKLAGRIVALFEAQITILETKLKDNNEMSSADLRMLEAATKTVDKLIEAQKTRAKKDPPRPHHLSRELEVVRQKLIERVRELGRD